MAAPAARGDVAELERRPRLWQPATPLASCVHVAVPAGKVADAQNVPPPSEAAPLETEISVGPSRRAVLDRDRAMRRRRCRRVRPAARPPSHPPAYRLLRPAARRPLPPPGRRRSRDARHR